MAQAFGFDAEKVKSIIQSNNAIKKSTQTCVRNFLDLQERFFREINTVYHRLDTVGHVADIFFDEEKRQDLIEFQPSEHVQLAVCGYNSSGKTSLIHELLGLGKFLPVGKGSVTARIVKFSYAPPENACLIKYVSVHDHTEVGDRIVLSSYFTNDIDKKNLRTLIKEHLGRPENMDMKSPEFTQWATNLIEICIPSPILDMGLHVYDTPGFLASDAPVLRENLLSLVTSVHPTLLFLYDNSTVSDDSRKCYEQLKTALHSRLISSDIFFLNTKADVAVIRNDASNDDHGDNYTDEQLLERERLQRYNLLLNVDEMKGDASNEDNHEQCPCFDIFSTISSNDPMETTMKSHTINRILQYSAEHDLQPTKSVINMVHTAIDSFFDFVLVTNRRSPDEWSKLRNDALEWGENFFQQYRSIVDTIATEANQRLPQRFHEKHEDIKAKVIAECEARGVQWDERLYFRLYPEFLRPAFPSFFTLTKEIFRSVKSMNPSPGSEEMDFTNMLVEREVTKPVLQQIILEQNRCIQQSVNERFTYHRTKNELLYAACRLVLPEMGDFNHIDRLTLGKIVDLALLSVLCPILLLQGAVLIVPAIAKYLFTKENSDTRAQAAFNRRKENIILYLNKLETIMHEMGDHLKQDLIKWIDKIHKKFVNKINNYHLFVCQTIEDRHRAYNLARGYLTDFVRLECRLEANLNLAMHHGSRPVISQQEVLGMGAFFTVHPASWDNEDQLVAKKLRDDLTNKDFAYLEAHFHRTVTHLNLPHMAGLKYLYEENDSSLYLLMPRYHTDLRSFLITNIKDIRANKAIQISHNIASVIALMHAYGLVHRDVKVQNILMNEEEQVYLADFGTCQHGTENTTFVGSLPFAAEPTTTPSLTAIESNGKGQHSYQGTAVDVCSLGMLMYACAPKDSYIPPSEHTYEQLQLLDRRRVPEHYCRLIARCLHKNPKRRPTASQVVEELDIIAKQLCIVCVQAPRFARCQPCGHKTMCIGCLTRIHQRDPAPRCIVCKQVFTSIEEDDDIDAFFPTASN